MKARQRLDPGRFLDVAYADLVADPVAVATRIADRFGYRWSGAGLDAARAYVRDNPGGKHGRHRYSLEQFGLDRATVQRRFASYGSRSS
jgi:hypothetical protein